MVLNGEMGMENSPAPYNKTPSHPTPRAEPLMSLPIITRWLRRPLIGAALLATGMLATGGAAAPAEAQYYPYYAYNPYYAAYCNPYYNPYACPAAYGGYPGYGYGYGYGYPYYGYGAAALGLGLGLGFGFHHHHGFHGGGFRGGGGFHGHRR